MIFLARRIIPRGGPITSLDGRRLSNTLIHQTRMHSILDVQTVSFQMNSQKKGVLTLGIDYNRLRLKQCRKKYSEKEELSFMRCDLNERSISKIPETDVVLVLTVFHHWADINGFEEAEQMLKEIGKKTGKNILRIACKY